MSELRLPLDIEQLTEMVELRARLKQALSPVSDSTVSPPVPAGRIESLAMFLLLRLFITLGYLARSTNRPGVLTTTGETQLQESLQAFFIAGSDPVLLLKQAGFLTRAGQMEGVEWRCEIFAQLNPHLAGNYRPAHVKGNDERQVTVAVRKAEVSATHQGTLVLAEMFKKRDGTLLDAQEVKRVMILIGTIDNLYNFNRRPTQFSEALLASAHEACLLSKYTGQLLSVEIRRFLSWLQSSKNHPVVPTTTEQILADFARFYAESQRES